MKKIDLERHLRKNGCRVDRDKGKHTVWINPGNKQKAAVPRHREIPNPTARDICRQLGIPEIA
jgi:mRNA interferase HicA